MCFKKRSDLTIVATLLLVAATGASGQGARPMSPSMRLDVDNDVFAVRSGLPTDFDYTQGARLTISLPGAPTRLAHALGASAQCSDSASADRACVLTGFTIGQEIYTPRHNKPEPVAGDRPYAAVLFGATRIDRLGDASLNSLKITAGVTGPPALGEPLQNGMHRLLNNHLEVGWKHQIPTRLDVAADYDGTRLLAQSGQRAPSRFIAINSGATIGSLRRELRTGLSTYYSIGETHSRSADAPLVARPGTMHFVAGAQQSFVMYDALVEGVGVSPGAQRLPWVSDLYAGVGWRVGHFATEYRYVSHGREYP
ncbi:MAG: lipid A deacylase LpxR family protein, partial [bacterium]